MRRAGEGEGAGMGKDEQCYKYIAPLEHPIGCPFAGTIFVAGDIRGT